MVGVRITEGEILDALVRASADHPDAMTGPEMERATGISTKRLRAALKAFAAEGRLQVHRVIRTNIVGQQVPVPAYTILPKRE